MIDLDITVEQAMPLLMSAGIIQPGGDDPQNKLAALAETARAAQAARKAGAEPGEIGFNSSTAAGPMLSLSAQDPTCLNGHVSRGHIMGFWSGNYIGFFELCEFFRSRLPVGILVLGVVHRSRRRSSTSIIDDGDRIYS